MTEAGSSSAQETLQPDRNGETEQNDQHHGRSAQLENCLIVSSSNLCTSSCKVGKKGPWTLILTSSFPHEFTTTSAINPWPETAVFFFPPLSWPLPHMWPFILWVLTLAPCQVHGDCSIYLEFLFFDCEPQSDAAAADCGEVLSTSGLKGNNWFLPTRLEKVNFENPHRPSGRPINGFHLEKKAWRNF